nr:TRAP transporter small permease [uncultured Cohaesibacter sp.]
MTKLMSGLHRLTLYLCAAFVVAIIGALAVQIISRYVFNAPVHMTDDIAEISLVWLTFLGAAVVYRDQGHIGVDLIDTMIGEKTQRTLHILLNVLVITILVFMLYHIKKLYPLMSRLDFGTVPKTPYTTKFMLIQLPFAIGCLMTILFAIEAIVRATTGRPRVLKEIAE